jgi:hypothetical protein
MTHPLQALKNLAWDMLVFVEILLYWPFAIIIMLPIRGLDRRFGIHVFPALDRVVRAIADL